MQEMKQRKLDEGLELQQRMWTFPCRHGGLWGILGQECDLICILESSVLG